MLSLPRLMYLAVALAMLVHSAQTEDVVYDTVIRSYSWEQKPLYGLDTDPPVAPVHWKEDVVPLYGRVGAYAMPAFVVAFACSDVLWALGISLVIHMVHVLAFLVASYTRNQTTMATYPWINFAPPGTNYGSIGGFNAALAFGAISVGGAILGHTVGITFRAADTYYHKKYYFRRRLDLHNYMGGLTSWVWPGCGPAYVYFSKHNIKHVPDSRFDKKKKDSTSESDSDSDSDVPNRISKGRIQTAVLYDWNGMWALVYLATGPGMYFFTFRYSEWMAVLWVAVGFFLSLWTYVPYIFHERYLKVYSYSKYKRLEHNSTLKEVVNAKAWTRLDMVCTIYGYVMTYVIGMCIFYSVMTTSGAYERLQFAQDEDELRYFINTNVMNETIAAFGILFVLWMVAIYNSTLWYVETRRYLAIGAICVIFCVLLAAILVGSLLRPESRGSIVAAFVGIGVAFIVVVAGCALLSVCMYGRWSDTFGRMGAGSNASSGRKRKVRAGARKRVRPQDGIQLARLMG